MTLLRDKTKRSVLRELLYQRLATTGVHLAETVQTLRRILAKDQAAFATEVGVSLSTLRKIEQEGGNISMDTAKRILDRFGLELVVRVKD